MKRKAKNPAPVADRELGHLEQRCVDGDSRAFSPSGESWNILGSGKIAAQAARDLKRGLKKTQPGRNR